MSTHPIHNNLNAFHELAEVTRTLSKVHRLILPELISQGERWVFRLAECAGLSIANAS
ncbi:hypothetical protein [Candidatus Pantoea multigeneris]|uniref:hypothetical protein n=1 Tax=Candidatus Pantoea multigeneris TaxID=2608357 RepID=UPI00141E2FB0|nr:hypothetical protein [Pantoea multigeneris]